VTWAFGSVDAAVVAAKKPAAPPPITAIFIGSEGRNYLKRKASRFMIKL
jgi:hypothetical protein